MNRLKRVFISILLVVITTITIGCEDLSINQEKINIETEKSNIDNDKNDTDSAKNYIETQKNLEEDETNKVDSGRVYFGEVHFLDVGQGDSIFIQSGESSMLIDGGENDQGDRVVSYLKEQGVTKLDYVIGTHPHSDHIGGLDTVIEAFTIGKVILPEKEQITITFEEVLDAINNKGLKITNAVVGDTYTVGNGEFTIIGPGADYGDELNNWSVGIKLTFGDNSFVMYGDGETVAEYQMLESGIDLSADVLKVSHHGSSTSSAEEILEAIDPAYGVISVGEDNQYGHPHWEVMAVLEDLDIKVYRTDELGTVVATTDGTNITWDLAEDKDKNVIASEDVLKNTFDYVANKNSHVFHYSDCTSVSTMKEENKIYVTGTRSEAIGMGYDPCGICKP